VKGRVIALGEIGGAKAAALIVDGVVEDFLLDPAGDAPRPGTIWRAEADRPMKGQGGMTLRLPEGRGFFRGAQGLKPGQRMLVQMVSVPEAGKAVAVTDRVLFKGRAAILTPGAPGLNISRRIKDEEARVRLREIVTEVAGNAPWGVILRSAAVELSDDEIAEEIEALSQAAHAVLGDEGRVVECLFDGPDAHEIAWREWSVPAPDAIDEGADAFDTHGVLDALSALASGEPLPGGGRLFVEPTRALVAVDVNTGADTSPAAALKANLAAVKALPRALRLRGLGGQVVVDFAPLSKKDRRQIESALRAAFRSDPVETALVGWTPLGNFELQRKRERYPVEEPR